MSKFSFDSLKPSLGSESGRWMTSSLWSAFLFCFMQGELWKLEDYVSLFQFECSDQVIKPTFMQTYVNCVGVENCILSMLDFSRAPSNEKLLLLGTFSPLLGFRCILFVYSLCHLSSTFAPCLLYAFQKEKKR